MITRRIRLRDVYAIVSRHSLIRILNSRIGRITLDLTRLRRILAVLRIVVVLKIILMNGNFNLRINQRVDAFTASTNSRRGDLVKRTLNIEGRQVKVLINQGLERNPVLKPRDGGQTIHAMINMRLTRVNINFGADFLRTVGRKGNIMLIERKTKTNTSVSQINKTPARRISLLITRQRIKVVVLRRNSDFQLRFLNRLINNKSNTIKGRMLNSHHIIRRHNRQTKRRRKGNRSSTRWNGSPKFEVGRLTETRILSHLLISSRYSSSNRCRRRTSGRRVKSRQAGSIRGINRISLRRNISPPYFLPGYNVQIQSSSDSVGSYTVLPYVTIVI